MDVKLGGITMARTKKSVAAMVARTIVGKVLSVAGKKLELHQQNGDQTMVGNVFINNIERCINENISMVVINEDATRGAMYLLGGMDSADAKDAVDKVLKSVKVDAIDLFSKIVYNDNIGLVKIPFSIGEKKTVKVAAGDGKRVLRDNVITKDGITVNVFDLNHNIFSDVMVLGLDKILSGEYVLAKGTDEIAVFYQGAPNAKAIDIVDIVMMRDHSKYKITRISDDSTSSETKAIVKVVYKFESL